MRKRITLALLSMLLVPLGMMAQDVTVHPGNGSMMPALKSGESDTFYGWSGFATWKHEQLSLTITTGDSDNNLTGTNDQLTGSGQLAKPANNIFASADGTCLQIGKGRSSTVNGQGVGLDTYITIALPKGYRFTGYTITFHRINRPNGAPSSGLNEWNGNINFGETDNTFTYTSTTNSTDDNLTTYYGGIPQNNTTQHTISRTSDTDMGNVLYFKLDNGRQYTSTRGRAFIQLDKVVLYFTAENNTQAVLPSTATGTGRSAIDIPFTTSKVDYGQLVMRDINGVAQGSNGYQSSTGRMSYDGTIRDMNANMILYEDGSVRRDDEANGFDGTVGKMLDYHSGSISAVGDYFQLDPSNHHFLTDDGEAIYYIESPIWAMNTAAGDAAHKNPIGYRIVSAKFTCVAGTGGVYLPATFKIQYESTGHGPDENGTYGLNTYSGTYNWNPSYHTVWRIDQEGYIYGYVSYDGSIRYLAVDGNTISMVAEKPSAANGTFKITENNQICLKSDETKYIGWQETVRLDNEGNPVTYTDDEGNVWNRVDRFFVIAADAAHRSTYHEVTAASESSSAAYTFNIYGPDGTTVAETINGAAGGTKTVYGYNNDAIKIGVIGGTALITAEITMQALDPYIDRLDIVCQENNGEGGKLTQQFSATDFAVHGGKFTFYVPEGFPAPAKFSFENLYSHYGDETYYNTPSTNHARYFFVKSDYHQTNDNAYKRNNEDSYTTKVLTEKVGDTKFTFNNASTVSSAGGYFEEYAFNPSSYSSFIDFTFNQTEMTNGTVKTAYLFTCDEPRYNIAPTTATQHVYYAFYEMKIDMQTKTYVPTLTWQKIYDSSFDGGGKTDSKWGLTLATTETVDDHGRHSGYLTVTQILDKIGQRTGDNTVTGGPKNTDQILFVDGSKLMSIVENQTSTGTGSNITYTSHPKSDLMEVLDKNALIYLPYGSKSSDDNFAFNTIEDYTKTAMFRAANNIVITDKYGFYAPYDIQVDAAKSAKYTRQITKSTYKDEAYATVIMPFEIKLTNGQHVDDYGTLEFLQMNTENATSDKYYNYGPTVFFSNPNANVEKGNTEANTPYALHATQSGVENGVFIVDQPGAKIVATPDAAKSANSLFSATTITSTGNLTDKDGNASQYTFSHKGSFSGYKIPKTSPKTFYFANNGFYSSAELNSNYLTVDLLPFRSVYEVTSGGSAKVGFLHFVEGENETDGIDVLKTAFELDMNAPVYDLQGRMIAPTYREVVDKNLSSGIYVVNGVKIIVK